MLDDDATIVERFLDERTDIKDNAKIKTMSLYLSYKDFCRTIKQKEKSLQGFSKELKHIADQSGMFMFVPRRNSRQSSHFEGVVLK